MHLQSPDVGGTWMQAGLSVTEHRRRRAVVVQRDLDGENGLEAPLGIELGWIGWQVKRLGRRHFSLEVGIVDAKGREGVVRCSTFKVSCVSGLVASRLRGRSGAEAGEPVWTGL